MNICCIASEMKKKLRFFVCCIYNISREKKYGWNFMLNKTNWNLMVFTSFHISETKEFVQNKFIALLERFQKKKNKIFKFNSMHVLSLSLTIHHGEEKKNLQNPFSASGFCFMLCQVVYLIFVCFWNFKYVRCLIKILFTSQQPKKKNSSFKWISCSRATTATTKWWRKNTFWKITSSNERLKTNIRNST